MDNARIYLLKKIIGYKDNGHEELGSLNAKYIDDVSRVMLAFMKDSLTEIIDKLNSGETIDVDGMILTLNKKKKKK